MSGEGAASNRPVGIAAMIKQRASENLYEAYPMLNDLPREVWLGLSHYYMSIDEEQLPDNKALNMYCSKASEVISTALAKHEFDMEPVSKADFSAFLRQPKRIEEYRAALADKGANLRSKLAITTMPEGNKASDAVAIEQFGVALEGLADRIDRAVPQRPQTGRTAQL